MSNIGRRVVYDDNVFECVKTDNDDHPCKQCAFYDGMFASGGRCSENPCDDGHYVLKEKAQAPAVSQTQSKPTNPKDAIGVRKVPMSTVPAGVLMDVALALLEGASKYGRHNYRGVGVRASVYYDATIGHLMDWWEGDDIDQDSGLSHVTKAIASLVVLRDAMLQDKLTDDRPPRSKVFKRDFNDKAAAILDRHADKSPKHWTIADEVDA